MLLDISALESALGVDPEGPAGDDVLAAVGRGAIVDVIENSDGTAVRWESNVQVHYGNTDPLSVLDGSDDTGFAGRWGQTTADYAANFSSPPFFYHRVKDEEGVNIGRYAVSCTDNTGTNNGDNTQTSRLRALTDVEDPDPARLEIFAIGPWT